ncbi:MAG: FAD-dependent oxidoreductase [Planctomycetaceae bacterium]|nr:FAD-dependent oxidoreductase [Planctomycetaceae bacterium]
MPELSYDSIVVGQGLAGSAVAWRLRQQGQKTLVIDAGTDSSASRIAAGLIMPISGRRMAEWPDYETILATATRFYRLVEEVVKQPLFHEITVERRFDDPAQREEYDHRVSTAKTATTLKPDGTGFLMSGARLNVPLYLQATRQHFEADGAFIEAQLNLPEDMEVTDSEVVIRRLNVRAGRAYFCQGYSETVNPWFPKVPDRPVRGEIIRVTLSEAPEHVLCTEYWLAPAFLGSNSDGTHDYLAGATYDRTNLSSGPTEDARVALLDFVQQVTDQKAPVIAQYSAIRASTANRQIVVRRHENYPNLIVVNGLGSRGSLLAPWAAEKALTIQQMAPEGSGTKNGRPGKSVTQLAHNILRRVLQPGEKVLDATAGNGHDTLFLAKIVGSENVTAIDLQPKALESAKARLSAENQPNVQWLQGDHAILLEQLEQTTERYRAIVFNLGYLPGADKNVVTQVETTARAITVAERLLEEGGVMTVITYPGHDAGREEEQYLRSVATARSQSANRIDRIAGNEDDPHSPVLYVFRR